MWLVDLLPAVIGMNHQDLWVHPTYQHPNETVHAIAAEMLVQALMEDPETRIVLTNNE